MSGGVRRISVMGSTGSIGLSTLAVVEDANAASGEDDPSYEIVALAAGQNVELLIEQAKKFRPEIALISDETKAETLANALRPLGIDTAAGVAAITEAATRPCDRMVAAIVGIAGLASTYAALEAGNDVALANKESMVCAGPLLKAKARETGAQIVPVDSEHNAMFQVFERPHDIETLILTASGGPFLDRPLSTFDSITPEEAKAHPRWDMGAKICIDSASLMNKSLELIEAAMLFDMPESQIDVVIHPQSIIHSLISYRDGSVLAQLGEPDMRTPIAYALAWPDRRLKTTVTRLDLAKIGQLDFRPVDLEKFPSIRLARNVVNIGRGAPAILNCANEEAVTAFIAGYCAFKDISSVVERALAAFLREESNLPRVETLDDVVQLDAIGRRLATAEIERLA